MCVAVADSGSATVSVLLQATAQGDLAHRHLVSPIMPFANLPDKHKSRWGDELTAEKMKECIWLRPEAVAQIKLLEGTAGNRLRHSKFVGLRDDKNPREVVKEV